MRNKWLDSRACVSSCPAIIGRHELVSGYEAAVVLYEVVKLISLCSPTHLAAPPKDTVSNDRGIHVGIMIIAC